MQLHQIKRNNPNIKKKTVGRGGTRGKTSGRGHKGQNARAGGKPRPEIRDMIRKLPKKRGHGNNRARTVDSTALKFTPVNLTVIERLFVSGDVVSPATLHEKKVLRVSKGKLPLVKILGVGRITKKVTISKCSMSESAKAKIEKVGGEIKV